MAKRKRLDTALAHIRLQFGPKVIQQGSSVTTTAKVSKRSTSVLVVNFLDYLLANPAGVAALGVTCLLKVLLPQAWAMWGR